MAGLVLPLGGPVGLWQKSVAAVICGLGSSTVRYMGAEHGPGMLSQLLLETSAFTLAQARVGPGQAVFSQNPSWESGQEILAFASDFPPGSSREPPDSESLALGREGTLRTPAHTPASIPSSCIHFAGTYLLEAEVLPMPHVSLT